MTNTVLLVALVIIAGLTFGLVVEIHRAITKGRKAADHQPQGDLTDMSQQFDDAVARLKAAAQAKEDAAVSAAVEKAKSDLAGEADAKAAAAEKAVDDETTAKVNALADELAPPAPAAPASTESAPAVAETVNGGEGDDHLDS